MSKYSSLAIHLVLAGLAYFLLYETAFYADKDAFKVWLLGGETVNISVFGPVLGWLLPSLIMAHWLTAGMEEQKLRYVLGGGVAGFLLSVAAAHFVHVAPIVIGALTAAGGIAGWVLAPRRGTPAAGV
jgi:hypothetical protein